MGGGGGIFCSHFTFVALAAISLARWTNRLNFAYLHRNIDATCVQNLVAMACEMMSALFAGAPFTRCGGQFYHLLMDMLYADAEQRCAELRAHLAVPLTTEENQCAVDLADSNDTFIGLKYSSSEGGFVRADGQGVLPLQEGFWADGEPNCGDWNGAPDCGQLWFHNDNNSYMGWDDTACNSTTQALCQFNN